MIDTCVKSLQTHRGKATELRMTCWDFQYTLARASLAGSVERDDHALAVFFFAP